MRKSRRGGGNNNHQAQSQFNNVNNGTGETREMPPLNGQGQAEEAEVIPQTGNEIGEPALPEYSTNGNGNRLEEPELYSPTPDESQVAQTNHFAASANGVEQSDPAVYSNLNDSPIEPKPYLPTPSNNVIGRRKRKGRSPLINNRNEPNNPPPLLNDYSSLDPGLQLPDEYNQPGTIPQLPGAVGPYEPTPEPAPHLTPNGPNRRWRRTFPFQQYIVPGLLLLALMIGVFIMAYGIGLDRGKRSANDERDAFYQERIARLVAASGPTVTPGPNITPGTPSGTITAGPTGATTQTYARIDKIEGDRITVLLLGSNGLPTGVSLVIVTGKTSQVYKPNESQPTELRPGDNIIVNTEKNGDNYIVRTIVVLPVAS